MRAEEVRAILAGRKTQFRRVMKTQPVMSNSCGIPFFPDGSPVDWRLCPYGKDGDRLWVRETFIHEPAEYDLALSSKPYREASTVYRADVNRDGIWEKWSPSIHMPRKFSRITLEIVNVRVERLQDISEEDALAEVAEVKQDARIAAHVAEDSPARMEFWHLWQSINGPRSWDENPWVWVVEFKVIEGGAK